MNCEVLEFESWGIKSISSILLNKTTAFKFVVCQVRNPLKFGKLEYQIIDVAFEVQMIIYKNT